MKKRVCFHCFWRRWDENGHARCPDCGHALYVIYEAELWIVHTAHALRRLTSANDL